jgi:large subunit ribosomal protein L10
MVKPDKPAQVDEIVGRFTEADAVLLTEYRGLGVGDLAELRAALRDADAELKVCKNTLARIAVRRVGLDELVDMLAGPTAIAFVKGDAAAAAKALDDATKRFPVLVVKGGALADKVIDDAQARALASLEPRETQLSKIAAMMNSPVQQAANVFAALLRDLGSMLAQVLAQRESEPAPGAPAAGPADEGDPGPATPSTTEAQQEQADDAADGGTHPQQEQVDDAADGGTDPQDDAAAGGETQEEE